MVTLNAGSQPASGRVSLSDLGPLVVRDRVAVWNWRTQVLDVLGPDEGWDVELAPLDWDYRIVAPIVDGGAVIGDPAVYVSAADRRLALDADLAVEVFGGADEAVELVRWTQERGAYREVLTPTRSSPAACS